MELFMDGVKLMVLGMGMVFVFLLIMIGCMQIMSKVLAPFAHLLAEPAAAPRKKPAAKSGDENLAAAAVAAVQMFRAGK